MQECNRFRRLGNTSPTVFLKSPLLFVPQEVAPYLQAVAKIFRRSSAGTRLVPGDVIFSPHPRWSVISP
jgi:hypothetical protein